jgi:hypothetical protein
VLPDRQDVYAAAMVGVMPRLCAVVDWSPVFGLAPQTTGKEDAASIRDDDLVSGGEQGSG